MRQQSWTFACLPFANEGNPRSDNGPEFVAEAVQAWITAVGAKTEALLNRINTWCRNLAASMIKVTSVALWHLNEVRRVETRIKKPAHLEMPQDS